MKTLSSTSGSHVLYQVDSPNWMARAIEASSDPSSFASIYSNRQYLVGADGIEPFDLDVVTIFSKSFPPEPEPEPLIRPEAAELCARVGLALEGDSFA